MQPPSPFAASAMVFAGGGAGAVLRYQVGRGMTSWLGPGGHVLHYPVRRGELMNVVLFTERSDWQVESWTVRGTNAELANDFRGWHDDVQAPVPPVMREVCG